MPNLQKITLIGHLGKDPEPKISKKGKQFCVFSLAASWRGQDGDKSTTWYNISAFGFSGDFALKYLSKGSAVYVYGDFKPRVYTRKDGTEGMSLDVSSSEIQALGSRGRKEDTSTNGSRAEESPPLQPVGTSRAAGPR